MPANQHRLRGLVAGLLFGLLMAACTSESVDLLPSGGLEPDPTATNSVPTAVSTDIGTTPRPSPPSQTDTDWGTIWDALPESFPAFPGAGPTETGEGPVSAILDAGAVEPAEVAGFYQESLESAGFTVTRTGPYEDGSFQLEATASPAGCAVRITIEPLGGVTLITVLYGAACPFN